jgi:hypothetical protein
LGRIGGGKWRYQANLHVEIWHGGRGADYGNPEVLANKEKDRCDRDRQKGSAHGLNSAEKRLDRIGVLLDGAESESDLAYLTEAQQWQSPLDGDVLSDTARSIAALCRGRASVSIPFWIGASFRALTKAYNASLNGLKAYEAGSPQTLTPHNVSYTHSKSHILQVIFYGFLNISIDMVGII